MKDIPWGGSEGGTSYLDKKGTNDGEGDCCWFFPVQKNFVAWQSSKHSDSKFQRTFSPTQPPLLPTHTREHTQSRHPQRVGVVGGVKMAATRDPSTSSKRSVTFQATARCCCYLADPHGAFLHRQTIFSPNTHTHTHTHTHKQTNKHTNKPYHMGVFLTRNHSLRELSSWVHRVNASPQ